MKSKIRLLFGFLVLSLLLVGSIAWAQATPAPPIDAVLAAAKGHAYALLTALVINWVVALTKTGWLSTWLAKRIPPAVLPIYAVVLGVLANATAAVIGGTDWRVAILQGIEAGALAVLTHETIVEGARKGKELVGDTLSLQAFKISEKVRIPTPVPSDPKLGTK